MTLDEFIDTYKAERPRWLAMIRCHTVEGDEEDILHNAIAGCLHVLDRIESIGFITWRIRRQIWKDKSGNEVTSKGRITFRKQCVPLSEIVEAEDNGAKSPYLAIDYRFEEELTRKIQTGEALALLSEKSRRVFTAYYIEDCDVKDVAERELSTNGYIKQILVRGRAAIRGKLGPHSVALKGAGIV